MTGEQIHSKRCTKCMTCKPIASYSIDRQKRDGYHPYCGECRKAYTPKPKGTAYTAWSDFADDVIREQFPEGGVDACLRLLTGRTAGAIVQRARRLEVKPATHWGLPIQDSEQDHRLWQSVRMPVFAAGNLGAVL